MLFRRFNQSLSPLQQRRTAIVAFIQFVHALEFMAVTPLFFWIAVDLSVPAAYAGYAAAAYMGAAALAGLAASRWMGRRDPRQVLLACLLSLTGLTAAGAAISCFATFLLLRMAAGAVGGVVMGAAMAALLSGMDAQARAKAVATVVSAFALVSIAGMPITLSLAVAWGWRPAILILAALCLAAWFAARRGLEATGPAPGPGACALPASAWRHAVIPALAQAAPLLLIPVLIPALASRYGTGEAQMPVLFLVGGVAAIAASHMAGKATPAWSEFAVAGIGTALLLASLALLGAGLGPAWLGMVLFMAGSYARLVAATIRSAAYPSEAQRSGFMNLQTACLHMASCAALALPSILLTGEELSASRLNALLALIALIGSALPLYLARLGRTHRRSQ